MHLPTLVKLNELWQDIYPHLALHAADLIFPETKDVLELGPFAGGWSWALADIKPNLHFTLADSNPGYTLYLENKITALNLEQRCTVTNTSLATLTLPDNHFQLVLVRGAFFFMTTALLQEIWRVLTPGGHALVGGGFGKYTPAEVIKPIATLSKQLNYALGKNRVSVNEVHQLVSAGRLQPLATISTEGGLWIILSK